MSDTHSATIASTNRVTRPFWLPDTQGFLAVAIIMIVAALAFILLTAEPKFDDKVAGAFMTLLGVLTACLKDVYSYFFGSSKGEDKKGDVISNIATTSPPPAAPSAPTTDQIGTALLSDGELVHYNSLTTEEAKKNFLAMSATERAATIAKG